MSPSENVGTEVSKDGFVGERSLQWCPHHCVPNSMRHFLGLFGGIHRASFQSRLCNNNTVFA